MPRKRKSIRRRHIMDKPTRDEWDVFPKSKSCVVCDPSGFEFHFEVGEDVLVLGYPMVIGTTYSDYEYWVAKLLEFGRDWDNQDWAAVHWYWSGKDISDASNNRLKAAGSYGKYERSPCDCIVDFISMQSIHKKANVHYFDEGRISGDLYIPSNEFFWRRRFYESELRTEPRLLESATCPCKRPYNPDADVMRFCPGSRCQLWFHVECLIKWTCEFRSEVYANEYEASLRCNMPDTELDFDNYGSLPHVVMSQDDNDLYTKVLEIATQPIVRGRTHGIVGNAYFVLNARRWLCCCQNSEPDSWRLTIDGVSCTLEQWLDDIETRTIVTDTDHPWKRSARKAGGEFVCMNCHCAI